jgi:CelD/BcsL family acetyltransferase involved in cellulose biosynthesis
MEVHRYDPALWSRMALPWQQLASRCGDGSAFMSASWIGAWWESFGERLRPEVLQWRAASRNPAALLILTVRPVPVGPLRLRAAYLNATGEGAVGSEHNTLLCLPGFESIVRRDLAQRLRERRVDLLKLEGFHAGQAAGLLGIWGRSGPQTGFYSEDRYVPLRPLRQAGTAFLASVSRNTREQISRSMRRYAQRYGATPRIEVARDAAQSGAWFAELRELHALRMRSRGKPGAFADPAARAMHERLIGAVRPGGGAEVDLCVDMLRISAGEQPIGYLYNLIKSDVVAFYQSGLRYEADARLKPGLVSHALAIQHYLDAGRIEYDFLAGEALPAQYKASLATGTRRLGWLNIYRPSLKLRTLDAARRLWRAVRRTGRAAGASP